MKLSKKQIKKILSDDVLIYENRKQLWKNGITPHWKLSDEVLQFLTFLEEHNHLTDFIHLFENYSETIVHDEFGVIGYKENKGTLTEYFNERAQRFYLRGAYRWYVVNNRAHLWDGLENGWRKLIKLN